jgi:RNA polymerase sigma-70 factor (ECF subfamily)
MRQDKGTEHGGTLTDHQLMLQVRDGQLQQLSPLFERHHRHLYNFFLKQTNDRPVSEDLVQEVFLRMLKYRHTYKDDGKYITWMFTIAHRIKVDYYKKKSHQHESMESLDLLPCSENQPDAATETADRKALIARAMDTLSTDHREILLMARFDEMKYEDIGAALGIKVGTVKARVHRAMKALAHSTKQMTEGDRP